MQQSRSAANLLVQPVVFSWLQNTRSPCCLSAAAACCTAWAQGQHQTRTLVGRAADITPQQPQHQGQQQTVLQQTAAQGLHESHHNQQQQHQGPSSSCRALASPAGLQHPLQWRWGSQAVPSLYCTPPHLSQAAAAAGFSSSSSSSSSQGSQEHHPFQQLHGIHPSSSSSQQPLWPAGQLPPGSSSSSSNGYGDGSTDPTQQQHQQQQWIQGEVTVHPFPQEGYYDSSGANGFRPRSFRRREPQFQVIEFFANGLAQESFVPRTAQELGLHPRDVTLFAPLSRLAAPQRATIAVHDGKILVKTEVVKAIITADKAVLIKGRRQHDTQKLAQAILAANDARLKSIQLSMHQNEQLISSIVPGLDGSLMGSCERAASAADLIRAAADKALHGRTSMRRVVTTPGGTYRHGSSSSSSDGSVRPAAQQQQQQQQQRGFVRPGAQGFGRGGDASGFGSRLEPSAVSGGQQLLAQAGGSELQDVPFEMLVLEVLLDATAEYFYTKVQHLNWMLESIAADIRQGNQPWQGGAIDKAHQLIPIQKFMTSLKNDVRETCDALKAVLADDETLEDLCLSWHIQQRQHTRWTPVELQKHNATRWANGNGNSNGNGNGNGGKALSPDTQVRLLTEMLESYEREIQSLEGSINEAEEDLDNTRSIWHMQLDSSRNHIIMVNLWLSIVNISVMATTILPAFFGMNLSSGLSDVEPFWFYAVCSTSVALAVGSYPVARFWFFRNWKKANQSHQFEQKVLRVLLVQHIEDVDQIISALRSARYRHLDRKAFRSLMYDTLGNRAMSATNMDFLWEAFDRDRDNFLAEAEHLLPIHNYGHTTTATGTSSSNSSASSSSSAGPQQQQPPSGAGDAGFPPHPAAGLMPSEMGALEGLGSSSSRGQGPDVWPAGSAGGESLAQWQGRALVKSVRATPYQQHKQQLMEQQQGQQQMQRQPPPQQQQQQQQKQKQEPQSWADDDRFSWD